VDPTNFDFHYTTPAPYCKADKLTKGKCTVQLNFIKGQPVLRLCSARGEPGRTVPLTDATAARKFAKMACRSYNATKTFPATFEDTIDEDTVYDPEVEERATVTVGRLRRQQPAYRAHDRSERLWARVESARTEDEREAAREAAEAYDARLAGVDAFRSPKPATIEKHRVRRAQERASQQTEATRRLQKKVENARDADEAQFWQELLDEHLARQEPLAGTDNQRMMTLSLSGAPKRKVTTMAAKKKASKLKWCVFKVTKSGRRKVSCHKLKRTAKAAAKRKGGKGNRVVKVR
jgi:hypothetical protein